MKFGNLATVDILILLAYIAGTIFLGWWFGRKQESTKEYFTGTGRMNPLLIGVSLFATLLSSISYLSMPGEAIGKGPGYLGTLLIYPLVFLVVGFGMMPVYMKLRVTSAYELLEIKLGPGVRVFGAILFIILRLVWMSLLIYLTGMALSIMLDVDEKWVPVIVSVTGLIAIIYTSLGGLRAVVWTDLMQTVLLFGGAVLVIAVVSKEMGGFGWFPTEWNEDWDVQPLFPSNLSTRLTVTGSMVSMFIWMVATSGGDQVSVQRFMSVENPKAARKAIAIQLSVGAIVAMTLACVGFALLGFFQANPGDIPTGMELKGNADKMFPHFIARQLPPIVSGLVLAGLFAAAMSSIDSGVNSITAVVLTDFVNRKKPHRESTEASEAAQLRFTRILAFIIGAIVVALSSIIKYVPGNITGVTNKTTNLLTTPIFCLFFFALFVPFASTAGVLAGAVCGITAAVLVAFSGPIFGYVPGSDKLDPISFQWIAPSALVVNIVVGLIVSKAFPNKERPKTN